MVAPARRAPAARRGAGRVENGAVDDKEILGHIDDLVRTERELREKLTAGELSSAEEHERLRSAEAALDQCWDLLRQRRARRDHGEDPDQARARPVTEVEDYLQ